MTYIYCFSPEILWENFHGSACFTHPTNIQPPGAGAAAGLTELVPHLQSESAIMPKVREALGNSSSEPQSRSIAMEIAVTFSLYSGVITVITWNLFQIFFPISVDDFSGISAFVHSPCRCTSKSLCCPSLGKTGLVTGKFGWTSE